jgi:hypothetical protein
MSNRFVLLAVILILTACGSADTPVTVAPTVPATRVQQAQPTVVAAAVPTPLPATPTIAAIIAPPTVLTTTTVVSNTDWVNTASAVGDFYVLGNPNAPIRLIDYSDFL